MQLRHSHDDCNDREAADDHYTHRQIAIGAGRVLARAMLSKQIRQSASQSMPNRWNRAKQADDPAGRDRAGADVKNVGAANIVRSHLTDRKSTRLNSSHGY